MPRPSRRSGKGGGKLWGVLTVHVAHEFEFANSHNSPGGHRCSCHGGFKLVGRKTCIYQNYCHMHTPPNGGCEQTCTPTSGGPNVRCSCDDGLELGADLKSCRDVDECALGVDGCEQKCVNTDPRLDELGRKYFCTCDREGYVLNLTDSLFRGCVPMSLPAVAAATGVAGVSASGGGGHNGGGQALVIVVGTLGGAAASALLLALVYRRRINREMMSAEVKAIMREYIALPDDSDLPVSGAGAGAGRKAVRFSDQASRPRDIDRTPQRQKEDAAAAAIEVTPTSVLADGLDSDEDDAAPSTPPGAGL